MAVVKANSSDIDLLARYFEPKVKEIVLLHGTISLTQDVLNFTVFMNPQVMNAQIFTIHFNLFLYNRLTYNYDKKEY